MDGAECHVVGPEVLTEAAEMVVQVASVLAAGERFEELIPPERSPVSRSMWECGGGRLLRGVLARAGERAGPRVASRECCPLTAPVEYPPRTVNHHRLPGPGVDRIVDRTLPRRYQGVPEQKGFRTQPAEPGGNSPNAEVTSLFGSDHRDRRARDNRRRRRDGGWRRRWTGRRCLRRRLRRLNGGG